jgi:hypothetical protein
VGHPAGICVKCHNPTEAPGSWYCRSCRRVRRCASKRRERIAEVAGSYTKAQMEGRAAMFGYRCWLEPLGLSGCTGRWEANDHVIPLARGGTNFAANMRPICTCCNSKRGARSHHQFLKGA